MHQPEIVEAVEQFANYLLMWVGFGTLVGLLAKAILPGRDPGGAIVTVLMGIGGSVIGCALLMYFWQGQRVAPISPVGFLVATGGTILLLLFYRLFAGHFFVEGEHPLPPRRGATRRRRGTRHPTIYIDE